MCKCKNNNYNQTERYLREEQDTQKKVGNSGYDKKGHERKTVENGTFDKKCSDKQCQCNGGANKYCK